MLSMRCRMPRNPLFAAALAISLSISTVPIAAGAPPTFDTLCAALSWPRPMPAVVGLTVDPLSQAPQPLTCLSNVTFVGPEGAVPSGTATGRLMRISSVTPAPSTPVGAHDAVTVNLIAAERNSPPTYRPCDWVSTAAAATLLGAAPIAASANGVEQGSTDISCDYSFNDSPNGSPNRHSVVSELRLTEAHVVDAATEYEAGIGADSLPVDGIGVKAACTPVSTSAAGQTVRRLQGLLPGERLYIATGWGGESCDTLGQFARAAIPRIDA